MTKKIKKTITIIRGFLRAKIFCISFQRTGTTSTGQFFKDHGYSVAGYDYSRKNDWTLKWFTGNHEAIFESVDFQLFQVFEDDPWWCQDFYKVLFHRFPSAKFILLERDSNNWFDSMIAHSNGRTLGNTYLHSKIYRREKDFYQLNINISNKLYSKNIDNLLTLEEQHREHYKAIYELRNREVKEFFNQFDPSRLFVGKLEDSQKWIKLGEFFNIQVNSTYDVHVNKSK